MVDDLDPDKPCLAPDFDGPVRRHHLLCWRAKGHQGPHGNSEYEWANELAYRKPGGFVDD